MPRKKLLIPNYRLRLAQNGFWYVDWTEDGKPRSRSTKQRDRGAAETVLAGYHERRPAISSVRGAGVTAYRFYQRIPTLAYVLWRRAQNRARTTGREFSLSREDVEDILRASKGRCTVTGIPFDLNRSRVGERRPWGPSLDRIKSAEGYTRANCRAVCVVANYAMNTWGEAVLTRLLDGYAEWRERGFVFLESRNLFGSDSGTGA